MTSLVLGDDHPVFVDALATVLTQQGFTVDAVVRTAAGVAEAVREQRPDVCLLDKHFPDGDGIDRIRDIMAGSPTKVVVLTADGKADGLVRALDSGAVGYVHKTRGVADLVAAIGRVMDGDLVIEMPGDSQSPFPAEVTNDAHRLAEHLTARERECLALLVEGLSTRAMVQRLGVSSNTVRSHVQTVLTKLGVHSRLEACSFAVRHSLLDASSARYVSAGA